MNLFAPGRSARAAVLAGLLCGVAPAALAQTADASRTAAPASATAVDEIFVTARRQSENVQEIPVAVSVVNGDILDKQGTYNVAKLTQIQPTLQFYSQNPRNTFINIRAIGAPFGLTNDGFEQGVGVYVDDVYYNRIASATLDFVDVQQIETLRGPQGTLYGKNTTAGAINITTRAPSFDLEAKAEVSLGNLQFKQAKASISGPITENVAARLSVSSTDRRGTVYNTTTDQWIQSQDNIGIRASLLWRPTSDIDVTFSGDYNLQDANCCAFSYGLYGPTQRPANRQYWALVDYAQALFPGYAPSSTDPYERITDADAELRARNELGGLSARVVWNLDERNTLTSITAWRYWDWGPSNDRDYTGLPIYTKSQNPTLQDQYSQEIRFNHEADRYNFVVGGFAFFQKIRTTGFQDTGLAASKWLLNPTSALSNNPAVMNNVTSENDIRLDNTSFAVFGKLNWDLNDRLTISPGLRINYDKKEGLYDSVVTGTASDGTRQVVSPDPTAPYYTDPWTAAQRGVQASQYFAPELSDWNLSYDINVAYAWNDNVNLYATYARSFKTGGINLNGAPADANGVPIEDAFTIKPEKVDHFEAGVKTQFWDRRATLNVTGFWTEIEDFQASVTNAQYGLIRGYLSNAAGARTRGIEADFSVRPNEYFNGYINGAFTDATYTDFKDAPCPPELSGGTTVGPGQSPGPAGVPGSLSPANCDVSGSVLPGVSKYAASWGGEVQYPGALFGEQGEFYLGYDASYRSKWSSNPSPSIYTWVDGYALHNFRGGFRTDQFDAFLWVRNAFDQDYIDIYLAGTGGNTGLIAAYTGDPRTWGGTLKYNF